MVLLKNFPAPSEGVHHTEPDTRAFVGEECLGKGSLYISESVLCWLSSDGDGFSLRYPAISMHAQSNDVSSFPHACICLMIDAKLNLEFEMTGEASQLASAISSMQVGDGDNPPNEEVFYHVLRLVPDNEDMLETIFKAIADCQTLNPDPEESDDDDDDGVVIAPRFDIQVANGSLEDFEIGDEEDEDENDMDDEDQFEDAES